MNCRFFYNHNSPGDCFYISIDPLSKPLKSLNKDGITLIYGENDALLGINIFDFSSKAKLKHRGVIFAPGDELFDHINSLLKPTGIQLDRPLSSGTVAAKIIKIEEHPLDAKLSILTLDIGKQTKHAITGLKGIVEGRNIAVLLPGYIDHLGELYEPHKVKNVMGETEVLPASAFGGEDDSVYPLDGYEVGEDPFYR